MSLLTRNAQPAFCHDRLKSWLYRPGADECGRRGKPLIAAKAQPVLHINSPRLEQNCPRVSVIDLRPGPAYKADRVDIDVSNSDRLEAWPREPSEPLRP
jgi:hypothetical protein